MGGFLLSVFMKKEILNYILIIGISLTMVVPNIRSLDQMIPEFIYYGILTALSLGYITFFGLGTILAIENAVTLTLAANPA